MQERFGDFKAAARKWVTNYWYMKEQCEFVTRSDGTIETFPDTWGLLALQLFFERYSAGDPTEDVSTLVSAAYQTELHKLIGVPETWLDERIEGAADMLVNKEAYAFEGFEETSQERKAARDNRPMPKPPAGTPAERRERKVKQLKRRTDNRNYLRNLYKGKCQISGIVLKVPGESFTVDYAHIRPLGGPHSGPDDVGNMLSLSPTMHRLFDRGCIHIDPDTLEVTLLHGNDGIPHLKKLLVEQEHGLSKQHLKYHNLKCH